MKYMSKSKLNCEDMNRKPIGETVHNSNNSEHKMGYEIWNVVR